MAHCRERQVGLWIFGCSHCRRTHLIRSRAREDRPENVVAPRKANPDAGAGSSRSESLLLPAHGEIGLGQSNGVEGGVKQDGRYRRTGYPTNPSENKPNQQHLANDHYIVLDMDDSPQKCGRADRSPRTAARRSLPATEKKSPKQRLLPNWRDKYYGQP